jgi:hypothetical protein
MQRQKGGMFTPEEQSKLFLYFPLTVGYLISGAILELQRRTCESRTVDQLLQLAWPKMEPCFGLITVHH